MARYLIKASYTAEGTKGLVKDGGTSRRSAVEKMLAGVGGKLEAFYFAFGEADVYAIFEVPDSATAAAMSFTINGSGAVSSSTTVLLTAEEVDAACKKSITYRAPGR